MKRFVWRLQKVLDIRTKQEQLKRIELFQLVQKISHKRGELLICRKILRDLTAQIAQEQMPERLNDQALFLKYSVTNNERIERLKTEITELELQQRKKIAEVLAIKRFREGLEKLRAEAKMQFIREQEKLEQKELDERAAISFARRADLSTVDPKPDQIRSADLVAQTWAK